MLGRGALVLGHAARLAQLLEAQVVLGRGVGLVGELLAHLQLARVVSAQLVDGGELAKGGADLISGAQREVKLSRGHAQHTQLEREQPGIMVPMLLIDALLEHPLQHDPRRGNVLAPSDLSYSIQIHHAPPHGHEHLL